MRRRFLCLFLAVFFVSPLYAQINRGNPQAAGIFPLALVLEGAEHARDAGAWRPDWPFELPPDAFKVLDGELSRASIVGEGYSLNLAFGPDGRVEEFPFMLTGVMTQVSLEYNDAMEVRELTLAFPSREEQRLTASVGLPGEEPWKIEFLEHRDSLPVLGRGFRLNTWYFIFITWGPNEISESWYDVAGNFLGAYSFPFANIGQDRRIRAVQDFSASGRDMEFHFDSRGLVTETAGVNGFFNVHYFREDLPRYWERRPVTGDSPGTGNFSFQWDLNGILLRITGDQSANRDSLPAIDLRYEYSFDEWGNWVERREIRMVRALGHLVPTQGTVFIRNLEYKDTQ
jgi:hypothetical protein